MVVPKSFDFSDLTPIAIPVKYAGREYVLKEADGEAVRKYKNTHMAGVQLDAQGNPVKFSGVADSDTQLLGMCLYNDQDKRVGPDVVRTWPNRVLIPLIEAAKEISGLEESSLASLHKQRERLDEQIAMKEAKEEKPLDPTTSDGSP